MPEPHSPGAPGQPPKKKNTFIVSDFSFTPPPKKPAPKNPAPAAVPPAQGEGIPTLLDRTAPATSPPTLLEAPAPPLEPKTLLDAPQPTLKETLLLPDGAATIPSLASPGKPQGTFAFTLDTPVRKTVPGPSALPTHIEGSTPSGGRGIGGTTHLSKLPVAPTLELHDLVGEKLLLAAPRGEYGGQEVPTLGGIWLLSKLGQGGMGAVYYGIHPHLNKEVAVKVLPFHLAERDPDLIARFFREAQIAAKIKSPHLVSVTDACEEQGLCYLVMEYVAGGTASGYLKSVKTQGLPEAEALEVCIAAAKGLEAAHQQGIIHRDIKPDNILIPKAKGKGTWELAQAKLADLGLARFEEHGQSLTGSQASMGTPGYMSPEQALDARTCGKAADIFSMGATLYALLCGRAPFHGKVTMDIIMNTIKEPHAPAASMRPEISPATNILIERCLAKEPHVRFKDGSDLIQALVKCKDALGKEGKVQRKLVEELRGPLKLQEAKPAPAPQPASTLVVPNEPVSLREATLLLQPRIGEPKQRFPVVATIVLSVSVGVGLTLFFTAPAPETPDSEEAAAPEAKKPPKAAPRPAPPPTPAPLPDLPVNKTGRLSAEEQLRDRTAELERRFNKVEQWTEKAEVLKPMMPVSSVGQLAKEESQFTAARLMLDCLIGLIGSVYALYGRKSGSMLYALTGAVMVIAPWFIPSIPWAVVLGGVLASLPLFVSRR